MNTYKILVMNDTPGLNAEHFTAICVQADTWRVRDGHLFFYSYGKEQGKYKEKSKILVESGVFAPGYWKYIGEI